MCESGLWDVYKKLMEVNINFDVIQMILIASCLNPSKSSGLRLLHSVLLVRAIRSCPGLSPSRAIFNVVRRNTLRCSNPPKFLDSHRLQTRAAAAATTAAGEALDTLLLSTPCSSLHTQQPKSATT